MNRRVEEPAVLQPRHVVLRTTTHGTACWPLAVLLCLYFGSFFITLSRKLAVFCVVGRHAILYM